MVYHVKQNVEPSYETALRPVSTKPFFLRYVKWETDIRKKNCLSGHGFFAMVSSLPSDRLLTVADNTGQNNKRCGQIGSVDMGLYSRIALLH